MNYRCLLRLPDCSSVASLENHVSSMDQSSMFLIDALDGDIAVFFFFLPERKVMLVGDEDKTVQEAT